MENTKQNVPIKILKISVNTLFYLIIVLLLVFSIANIQVKRENDIANVFGVGFLSVQSDSMSGNVADSFDKGDMVFVRMLDDQSRTTLEIGDIVTYYDLSIKAFNTHRIIDIFTENNQLYFITQGDNTPGPDQPINAKDALATYSSSFNGVGETLDYIQSPTGFALFVILPVVVILIFEGIVLARNVFALNKAKMEEKYAIEKESTKIDLESEKEKIRAQILAELEIEKQKNK